MAITRAKKEEVVADLTERMSRTKVAILTDFKGLDVTAMTNLRNELRKIDAEYQVVKNTLLKLSVKDTEREVLDPHLKGTRAVAVHYLDPVAPAKVLVDFAKTNDKLAIIAGVLQGKVLSEQDIRNLAKLPPKEQLLAQLLAAMNAVPTGIVQVLAAVPRQLLNVLVAIRDKKSEGQE